MKAVILAGGFGTRLSEYTDSIPKPMVEIGGKPILLHIMEHYASYGVEDFVIAAGYKSEVIKQYFLNMATVNSNFSVDLASGEVSIIDAKESVNWNVTVIDTGIGTMTGGRLLRLQDLLQDEPFHLTYGDGLSDVDISELQETHLNNNSVVTVTAVRPVARFGAIGVSKGMVTSFEEKPQLNQGWINGGFFIMEPEIFSSLTEDDTVLEKEPLSSLATQGKLSAYFHEGFWQCMDTKRDRDTLEEIWKTGEAPWQKE